MSTAPSEPQATRSANRRPLWGRQRQVSEAKTPLGIVLTEPVLLPYRRPPGVVWVKVVAYLALAVFCISFGALFALNAPRMMVVFAIPIAVTVAIGIWALPSGEYAPTSAVRWLMFAFVSALVLWPNYLAIALPGLPWMTPLRLTGVPLALVLLVCASASTKFRSEISEVLKTDIWAFRFLLAFIVIQALTLALSKAIGTSISRFIVSQINWTGMFFAACYVFRRPGAVDAWVKMLLGAGFVLCMLGIWEAHQRGVLWAGHVPSFLKIQEDDLAKILGGNARAYSNKYRVQVIYGTPLGLAEFLGLTVPFAMHYALSKYRLALRLLGTFYIPLAIWVIILTDSRLGIVASLVSSIVYLLLWSIRRWYTNKGSILAPAMVLTYPITFTAFVASTFLIGRLRKSVWGGGAQQASTESRKIQWEMAVPKVMHAPWGNGQGRSGVELGYVAMDGTVTVDSYYITLLMDYGILGFLFFMLFFLKSAWTNGTNAFRTRDDPELLLMMPLAVALVSFVVIKGVFSQEDNHPLAFMLVAAGMALAYRSRRPPPDRGGGASVELSERSDRFKSGRQVR